ncbi:hypothetical protein [Novosphingobium panipatense]
MFEPLRGAMLDRAQEAGMLGDARTLLEILCLPHLTISDENGRHPYSAFLAQYLTRSRAEGIRHPYDDPEVPVPALRRVRRLISERVNYIPPVELRLRVGLCKLMFLNMLMRRDSGFPDFDQGISLDALVDDTGANDRGADRALQPPPGSTLSRPDKTGGLVSPRRACDGRWAGREPGRTSPRLRRRRR